MMFGSLGWLGAGFGRLGSSSVVVPQVFTLYVDSAANPGGDGSVSTPFNTLADLEAAMQPGDSVGIRAGSTFSETLTVPASVTIRKWGSGADPILQGSGTDNGLTLGDGCLVANLLLDNWDWGCISADGATISDLLFTNCVTRAISLTTAGITFTGNRITIYDTGLGGGEGVQAIRMNAAGVTATFVDLVIDGAGEDCVQIGPAGGSSGSRIIIQSSYPGASKITGGDENLLDFKSGGIRLYGVELSLGSGTLACLTSQGDCEEITLEDCIVNHTIAQPAIQIQEKEGVFTGRRNWIHSPDNAPLFLADNGSEHTLEENIIVQSGTDGDTGPGGAFAPRTGVINLVNNSFIGWTGETVPTQPKRGMVFSQTGITVTALSHDNTDVDGFYTASITEGNAGRDFGIGEYIEISGYTGDHVGWNGVYELLTVTSGVNGVATFLIPTSQTPTETPPLPSELDPVATVFSLPVAGDIHGNIFFGSQQALYFANSLNVQSPLGANFVGTSNTDTPIHLDGTDYDASEVTGTGTGSIYSDTGGNIGGPTWVVESGVFWDEFSISTISIVDEVATVTTASPHGFTVGTREVIFIRGANSPPTANGWHPCVITGTSTFTYPMNRGVVDQNPSGTKIWTQFKPRTASAARNFGAIQF